MHGLVSLFAKPTAVRLVNLLGDGGGGGGGGGGGAPTNLEALKRCAAALAPADHGMSKTWEDNSSGMITVRCASEGKHRYGGCARRDNCVLATFLVPMTDALCR